MITQYNIQDNIIPGQTTKFRGLLYRAEKKAPRIPCRMQCDCRLPDYTENNFNCSGFCYRWANGDNIVFRRIDELPLGECVIVETKFARACRVHGEVGLKKALYEE